VQIKRNTLIAARVVAGLAFVALAALPAVQARAAMPPHVVAEDQRGTTDSCAICHRTHAANTAVPYRTPDTTETTGTSLLIASDPAAGDVSLCFSCHGVAQLGSNVDVQSRFLLGSVHSLAPTSSPYGPSPKYCSSCHDSHGSDRTATDTPYPALLRSYEGTVAVHTGEEYCATCHTPLSATTFGERWASLAVFKDTAHFTGMAAPATGAGIRCSICHDPHGSAVAPLLVASLVPTSAPATFTVTADDRTFCGACHGAVSASWVGTETYATSAHASSTATTPITAKWVPAGDRFVGECQVCHAPMGRDDGSGNAIPKLLEAEGRVLCDGCHSASGVASTDTSSQARPVAGALTLAAVFSPDSGSAGRVSLYGRATAGGGPLSGPRQYSSADGTGPTASGDIDGDGRDELIVASGGSAMLSVYDRAALTGLEVPPAAYALPATATAVAVANVVDTQVSWLADYPEILVVDADGDFYLYGFLAGSLQTIAGPIPVGTGPWGLTAGNLSGSPLAEAVVTAQGSGELQVFTDDGLFSVSQATVAVGGAPCAPSIGDVWSADAGNEIVVADALAGTNVSVLDGAGALLQGYTLTAAAGGAPTASAIDDVLPGVTGDELAITFANVTGASSVIVVPQADPGPGLDTGLLLERTSGAGTFAGSLLAGDVDDDGTTDLVVGNGGMWVPDNTAVAPSIDIWRAVSGGSTLEASAETHLGGGTELAGPAPSLALSDLGPMFPSRHPIDEGSAAHVSTETAGFGTHVTCADCHNSHEAVATATLAPTVQGLLRGAWGSAGPSSTSYGVCYKCHPTVAAQFDPDTAVSVHAVVESATSDVPAATFVDPARWDAESVLYCTDCHGNDSPTGSQASGLHESGAAPILAKPYLGVASTDADLLCYACHKLTVYGTGVDDGAGVSYFQRTGPDLKLHSMHVASPAAGGHGLTCSACHVSHGTAQSHLLRDDIGFTSAGAHEGSCNNGCHTAAHTWPTL